MDKKLITKIGGIALATGLILVTGIGSPYSKYDIDGNRVKYRTRTGKVVEYKESDKIVYYQTFFGKDLRKVKVNGDTYTYYNSPVYKEAGKRYSNLLDKIGTTRDAERKAEIKKRIDEKYEREKEALEIIRR